MTFSLLTIQMRTTYVYQPHFKTKYQPINYDRITLQRSHCTLQDNVNYNKKAPIEVKRAKPRASLVPKMNDSLLGGSSMEVPSLVL